MPAPKGAKWERWVEAQIAKLWQRSPFGNSGITLTGPNQFTVDGSMTVTGDFNAEGKINNDALVNPLNPTRVHTDAQDFSVPAASSGFATIASVAVTVPNGFTQMLVISMGANATAFNSGTSNDFLYVRGRINDSDSGGFVLGSSSVAAGDYGVASDFRLRLLTGLTPGATVTFALQVQAAYDPWTANIANAANLDAALLWLR